MKNFVVVTVAERMRIAMRLDLEIKADGDGGSRCARVSMRSFDSTGDRTKQGSDCRRIFRMVDYLLATEQ
ncbi:uncharacterized protein A4U43_C05F31250 [Asparagus officinalis]|uniref:Uncharacterized protein n=1 Tax=Asparagus officinalis TaxID=4686 RepID=A0A5P1EVX5_ASPOF|nr:uncharacterized protein A4U43_C05F31250 [Asparagus officinalis]